jgi:hypothetical protein
MQSIQSNFYPIKYMKIKILHANPEN